MKYCNILGVQTCYNFLDSTIKIKDYINFLVENNIKTAFYADKNIMFGALEFFEECNSKNIKPIIGLNFELDGADVYLYCKNNNGYKKVISLCTKIQENLENNIKMDFEQIEEFISNDIFWIFDPIIKQAKYYLLIKLKLEENNIFYSLSSKNTSFKDNRSIFTSKINYLYKEDFDSYKALKSINEGINYDELNIDNDKFYLDIEKISNDIDIDIHNSNIQYIIDNVIDDVVYDNKIHFLKYPNSLKMPSDSYLKFICENKLEEYVIKNNISDKNIYKKRLEKELETIFKMGFSDYFLVVNDFVIYAKENNILHGPGRGSAAGSLVSFLLEITKIDPIKYNLIFERFLNIDRVTLPDIDIDFQDDRREEIVEYLFNKYKKYHFATISTFQTIGIKNALRDCGRIFGIPVSDINEMSKNVSPNNLFDLEKAVNENITLTKFSKMYPKIFSISKKIIGLPRQSGTHAAGVVFCDEELYKVVPLKVGINGILQTQYGMNYLEKIGLIKTDILGLRNLTIIQEVIKNIEKNNKIKFNLEDINLYDEMTFQTLQNGETSGIFQLESNGMTDLVKRMKISSIEEIAITSALFRPGPQDNIDLLLNRKNKVVKTTYINESIKNILEPTYGIIVYQEQVLEIFKKVASLSYNQADIIRRAISKKNFDLIRSEKDIFIKKAEENGYSQKDSIDLWNYIEKFADYGFNKSHAIAYSIISYWMAFLKTHYKADFYCSLLNGVIRNENKTSQYIQELKKYNYNIIAPSIKNPNHIYFSKANNIFMPLGVIKYIGPEFLKKLKEIFIKDKFVFNNLLKLLTTLYKTTLTEQKYLALAYAGAFDNFQISRKSLILFKDQIFNLLRVIDNLKNNDIEILLPNFKDDKEDLLEYEKEYIGFYVSSHPIIELRKKIKNIDKLTKINALELPDMQVNILVYVDIIQIKKDKNDKEMCFLSCSDETGKIDLTIFSSIYNDIKDRIQKSGYYIFLIKSQYYKDNITFSLIDIKKEIKKV
ncbi:DNA polymerase III subunit alpha [Spiroplasma litorale]|uniref:DNA-directed DNA polymerase n=1 Tax=Spiroplasma litorale TaxID=216942 RepID=A0A0K1W158_9MOLU|nr:DNA polymerase III subunit alpha [Spiroplasma litorale]AKX33827.1 DNA polymerase III subunit alpha [Spiroplasma litorale]